MTEEMICGIEIHQQLDTKKLFCSCETRLLEEEGATLHRRLRPTQSEMGEVDRAALVQAERRMRFRYQAPRSVSCLVDADEEPPHDADEDAMDITLTLATLMHAQVVDEVHFMRKIVIDGSNTAGFQRTALVAVDGSIEVNGKRIVIQSICLEEDAARKVETKGSEVTYRLDRLGIPLIEIATGPDMRTPEEVREVAARIGSMLRATKRVKRGIGTIREDLNISIPGGARVEIKGVQELRLLPLYVEREIERQRSLLTIQHMLDERGTRPAATKVVDLTTALKDCKSKVVVAALSKGGKVVGVALPGFEGVMKSTDGKLRLGAEMAQHAKTRGVQGIFHSDELPAYGVTDADVKAVRAALGLDEGKAFALCADDAGRAEAAIRVAVERANQAIIGVPEETRDPLPDGGTIYSRPLPGASRMYPETDVKPIPIHASRLKEIHSRLPEMPEQTVVRFVARYGVHQQQASQIVRDGYEEVFEAISSELGLAAVAARTLLSTLPELEKDGVNVATLSDDRLKEAFQELHSGAFVKEAMPAVLRKMAEGASAKDAVRSLGLQKVDADEAGSIIASIVKEKESLVREKGLGAQGPLMAPVMERLRGKVDGKTASELLRKEITKLLESE